MEWLCMLYVRICKMFAHLQYLTILCLLVCPRTSTLQVRGLTRLSGSGIRSYQLCRLQLSVRRRLSFILFKVWGLDPKEVSDVLSLLVKMRKADKNNNGTS